MWAVVFMSEAPRNRARLRRRQADCVYIHIVQGLLWRVLKLRPQTCFCGCSMYEMRVCQKNRPLSLRCFFFCLLTCLLPILKLWRFFVKVSQREPEAQIWATRYSQGQDLFRIYEELCGLVTVMQPSTHSAILLLNPLISSLVLDRMTQHVCRTVSHLLPPTWSDAPI